MLTARSGVHHAARYEVLTDRLTMADLAVAGRVWRRRHPSVVTAARLVGALGDPWTAAAAAVVAAAPQRGRPATLTPLIVVVAGAYARRRMAAAVGRPRPPRRWRRVPVEGPSFPSKHTTLAVLAAGACARTSTSPRGRYAEPAFVGVVVGAHWPTDVLAGIGFATACWWLADRCIERTS